MSDFKIEHSADFSQLLNAIMALREDIRRLNKKLERRENLGSPVWPEEPGMREVDAIFEGAAK